MIYSTGHMGIVRATVRCLTTFAMVCVFGVSSVLAQATGWAPPSNLPPTGNVSPVINVGTTSQIKRSGLGIDLVGTLSSLPVGTGLYVKAGSLFVEYTGSSALSTWVADTTYAISTSGRIRSHGVTSSAELQSDLLKIAGETGERPVCADNSTGKLKICGVALGPTVTFTANPTNISAPANITLSWSSTNAVSCAGTNFTTGAGNPTSGTKIVAQAAKSLSYIISCTDSLGQTVVKSAPVTYTAPTAVIPTATVAATSASVSSGATVTINWSSTNASSCAAITPSPTSFVTSNATSGSSSFQLTNNTASVTTVTFAIRCTSTTNHTVDGTVVVTVNPASAPVVTLTANPASLPSGSQLTTLTWSSTSATSCTGSGGTLNTSGLTSGSSTVSQSATTTYTVTCQNSTTGLTGTKSVTVSTPNAVPNMLVDPFVQSINVSSFPLTDVVNGVVTWSVANASSCTGIGFSTGGAVSGTTSVSYAPGTRFGLECVGNSSSPQVTSIFTPSNGLPTYASTLSWASTYDVCNQGGSSNVATSGSQEYSMTGNPNQIGRWTKCWKTTSDQSSISYAIASAQPEIVTFTGAASGTRMILDWTSSQATARCHVNDTHVVNPSGTLTIPKTTNSTYKLRCVAPGGYTTSTIIVP